MKVFFTLLSLLTFSAAFAQGNPSLSASYDKGGKNIVLQWQHADDRISSYIVERSSDNISFTGIYTKKISIANKGEMFTFLDENPSPEKNYYRLKIYRGSTATMYEATIPVTVISGNTEHSWLIYPVPVTGPVLHLQYNGTKPIEGVVVVQIICVASGNAYNRMRMASTTRKFDVPVNNLGRGVYDIRVSVGNQIMWNQRFVK